MPPTSCDPWRGVTDPEKRLIYSTHKALQRTVGHRDQLLRSLSLGKPTVKPRMAHQPTLDIHRDRKTAQWHIGENFGNDMSLLDREARAGRESPRHQVGEIVVAEQMYPFGAIKRLAQPPGNPFRMGRRVIEIVEVVAEEAHAVVLAFQFRQQELGFAHLVVQIGNDKRPGHVEVSGPVPR